MSLSISRTASPFEPVAVLVAIELEEISFETVALSGVSAAVSTSVDSVVPVVSAG
jgi:hypothetical protein